MLIMLFISCHSNEPEAVSFNLSEIIVQQSPWTLDRVEINEVKGTNGYIFTQSEIDEMAVIIKNDRFSIFEFYNDGTGLWDSKYYCPNCELTWEELLGENKVRWAYRVYFRYFEIRTTDEVIELVENRRNENGFKIYKPDGTFISGDFLNETYVWK